MWADKTARAASFDFLDDRPASRAGLAFFVGDQEVFRAKFTLLAMQVDLIRKAALVDAQLQV